MLRKQSHQEVAEGHKAKQYHQIDAHHAPAETVVHQALHRAGHRREGGQHAEARNEKAAERKRQPGREGEGEHGLLAAETGEVYKTEEARTRLAVKRADRKP